jgi:hypothetical protein
MEEEEPLSVRERISSVPSLAGEGLREEAAVWTGRRVS